jgi:ankyrin repeat protein
VRLVLGELPKTLDDMYERILRDIDKANREHAYRLLQCLTVAVRPLRVEELAEVLAVDFDAVSQEGIAKLDPDWRWEDHREAVLSTCSSLITIVSDRGSQVVQFSHFSVKEFLTSERIAQSNSDVSRYHVLLEPAHTILAHVCLGVLLLSDPNKATLWNLSLREYALSHWVDHARFENVSLRMLHVLEYFFDADNPHRAAWLQMDKPWVNFIYEVQDHGVPLYYAAACGLYYLVERLIFKHPQHINAKGGRRGTPLVAALHEQHIEVAQLLYRHGADVHIRGNRKRTLLHAAAVDNLVDTVQWLLDHGGNVNANCINRQTPLHLAVRNRPVNVARMLLKHQADANAQNVYGRTPLHLAVYNGHIDVARVLLEHNANVNAQNVYLRTPLHVAVDHGHLSLARMLIKHKANINAEDYSGRVALHIASDPVEPCDQLDIMRLLLEHGGANAPDNEGSTLLYKPLIKKGRRYIQSLKSSVERRVNINAKDQKGNTALQVASAKGYHEVVKLLREHGAK